MGKPVPVTAHGDDGQDENELITGEAVALDVRPAGIILRAAGTIIDWAATLLFGLLLLLLMVWLVGDSIDPALNQALTVSIFVFAILIVPMVVETLTHGRSLGKLAIGARIVRDDGGAISLRHSFIRALVGVVEIYMTFGGIAATAGLLNAKSKRLGDMLAGTYSQHERVPRPEAPLPGIPPALASWAVTADVATLPDRLSRRIAQFLRQAQAMTPSSRDLLASGLAEEAAPYVSPIPAVPAEVFLAGVNAMRRDREYEALRLQQVQQERLEPVLTALPHDFPNR